MKVLLTRASALMLMLAAASLAAAAAEPSAVGLWEKTGQSGMPDAWFRIIECNGVYLGRIVKLFPTAGQNPNGWRCTQCKGDQRNAPVLGITFIKGMHRQGLTYQDGSILDPRDGSVYNAQMQLSPDGRQLTVRGYVGIPLLGQSEVWHRVPDSAQQSRRFASCPRGAGVPI
jgi:uncharacterized protein (DUF2147 family)